MSRLPVYALLLAAALGGTSCGDDEPDTIDPGPSPIEIVENIGGRLTVNGAQTHPFTVERPGDITAILTAVSGDAPPAISIALGTWNGVSCALVVANDKATPGTTAISTVIGRATVAGTYCLRVSDPGTLTAAVDYAVELRHY
jgi:hypothetical protein